MSLRFVLLCGLLSLNVSHSLTIAADSVQATLGTDTAWTGEAVPLIITLYSPGPFSGTASFDLPELPRTAIIHIANPVVGSEEIDGESYLTQRHEFRLYTQQSGEIVLPPFQVNFDGKMTFTSDPEPMSGMTQELRFQSNRPPETEKLGVVIAATAMQVSQSWLPQNPDSLQAGDVIQRTVSQAAGGTTAMMLLPASLNAPDGIRTYDASPIVQDKTERGQSSAIRTDTIKYQFEHAGTFDLPTVNFVHWDPAAAELKRDTLPGITVSVTTAAGDTVSEGVPSAANKSTWRLPGMVLALVIVGWLGRKPAARVIAAWHANRNSPEVLAAKRIASACRANDPSAAYSALLDWQRTLSEADIIASETTELRHERERLSSILFAASAMETKWSGQRLMSAFRETRRRLSRSQRRMPTEFALPTMNPSHHSG
jgi:hypothetical protein